MDLTVACVFVQGHVAFSVEYVTRLRAMVRRHVGRPFRFVCLTDQPEIMPSGVEPISIEHHPGLKGWWAKIELFNPAHGLQGRVLYLDLDTLIVAPLAPIVEFPEPFALAPTAGTFEGTAALKVVKRFNSSVMVWDVGETEDLFKQWSPAVALRLWGDQDFIGERRPDAAAMPLEWFPRLSEVSPPLPRAAKVILAKKPKNHIAAQRWPWFRELWG